MNCKCYDFADGKGFDGHSLLTNNLHEIKYAYEWDKKTKGLLQIIPTDYGFFEIATQRYTLQSGQPKEY